MKEILFNLAMLDVLSFCKENNIDCSGTYLYKCKRGFTYILAKESKDDYKRGILSVTFYKNRIPHHFIHKN